MLSVQVPFVLGILIVFLANVNSKDQHYTFEVGYIRGAPDGVPVDILAVNGQFPGPEIRCQLGDTVHVVVKNNIKDRQGKTYPLSVHWHGLLMYGTIFADGPDHITQCPILFGKSYEYVFTPNQTGTYWWHSHSSWQYSEGMWGTLIVENPNEPYQAYYDHDALTITLNDWYHISGKLSTDWYLSPVSDARSPIPDSALLNGRGFYPCAVAKTKGLPCKPQLPHVFEVQRNSRHRIRIINTSALLTFQFSIEDHFRFVVIEVDGVDTVPVPCDSLLIAPAQRYSIVVTMNSRPGQYEEQQFLIHANMANRFSPGTPNNNLHPEAIMQSSGYPAAILKYKSVFGRPSEYNNTGLIMVTTSDTSSAKKVPVDNNEAKWPDNASPETEFDFLLKNPNALRPGQQSPAKPGISSAQKPTSILTNNLKPINNFTDFIIEIATSALGQSRFKTISKFISKLDLSDFSSSFRPWVVLNEKDLRPYDRIPAPSYFDQNVNLTIVLVTDRKSGITYFTFNGIRFQAGQKDKPVIFQMLAKQRVPKGYHPIIIGYKKVIQVIISNPLSLPHPFHLHGHTFWVVGSGKINGPVTWTPEGARRDTVVVGGESSVYIRFVADNPGAWLFHCHINWHHQAGLAAVFVEAQNEAIKLYKKVGIPQGAKNICKDSRILI